MKIKLLAIVLVAVGLAVNSLAARSQEFEGAIVVGDEAASGADTEAIHDELRAVAKGLLFERSESSSNRAGNDNDRDFTTYKVLLIADIFVRCNQHFKPCGLRLI